MRKVELIVGLFVLLAPCALAAQETIVVAPAGATTWTQMLAAERRRAAAPENQAPPQRAVPIMPAPAPREIGLPPGGAGGAGAPISPPRVGFADTGPSVGAGFLALDDDNTNIPPDTHGAAGPSHLMTMLNPRVRIQDKVGSTISTVSLSTFWTSGTGLSGSPFDPRVVYDSLSGRWIAVVDADGNLATSQVWFAISATSDPTGSWSFFGFTADGTGTTWADFPGFGVNSTWIMITNNMFTVAANPSFSGAKAWVIDKSTALAGGPLTTTVLPTSFDAAGGGYGFAVQPAVTFDPAEPVLYLVDGGIFSAGGTALLRLSRITGTGPAPVWSVVAGSSWAGTGFFAVANNFDLSTIGAEQSGIASTCDGGTFNGSACFTTADCDPTSGGKCRRVDTGDSRIGSLSVFRNGRLWCTHSGGLPVAAVDRTAVFWYQLNPGAMPAPIVQSGLFDGGAGVHHFYPSIAANMNDDAYIGFSRSDSTKFVEAVGAGRFAGDPLGSMGALTVLKAGEDSYYKTFSGDKNRWGDYSATVVDPSDDVTFWTLQEYARLDVGPGVSDDRWGTWWSRLDQAAISTATPTATQTATLTPVPGAGSCPSLPVSGCTIASKKAIFQIKNGTPDKKDKLKLLWKGVANNADFGAPDSATSYSLCMYGLGAGVKSLRVPAEDMTCGGPCWKVKPNNKGYQYKDKTLADGGLQKVKLKPGTGGRALVKIQAKGANISEAATLPDVLPVPTPTTITVQLIRDDQPTTCWEAVFPEPFKKNASGQVKALADTSAFTAPSPTPTATPTP